MTTLERVRLVGAGVDRVDGPLKVTGAARYPNDFDFPNLAHAVLVRSTIAAGRIRGIDTGPAEAAPGVLAVITHHNAPKLERGPAGNIGSQPPPPLQDDRVLHYGQYVAVLVADTAEQATAMRDGGWLVGYGMASVSYNWWQAPCQARATIGRDGKAFVRSAATDIGTGTYTVMTQLSAELLGLGLDQVRFDLGDTDMPMAPQAGGSGLTAALGNAVYATCRQLVQALLDTVTDDAESPLRGCHLADVTVAEGRIHRADNPEQNEAYTDILTRDGLDELTADGAAAPPKPQDVGLAPAGPFAAKFVEVHVDPDLGLVRVARVVSAIDGGRILNQKLARSQIIGATVGGIGMALLEATTSDPATGRIANATLGDYLIPVNADISDMDVIFVGEPDRFNPIGVKGVGEIGLVGIAAAIANAVYHATGRRIRSLPITIDRLL